MPGPLLPPLAIELVVVLDTQCFIRAVDSLLSSTTVTAVKKQEAPFVAVESLQMGLVGSVGLPQSQRAGSEIRVGGSKILSRILGAGWAVWLPASSTTCSGLSRPLC